ncbi:MAG: 30S ribosomal protein S6 [Candidatus Marinimicrobia bacterium]|mgnify:CR=1 FL=1|nr:30S ribosomal protein S6 [Candidatus Neomarinimicrobiota bacterium]MBT3824411.1 30S ribosomal protein S6 [Candidatus Neomarinimicrobiota bacterium]MBT4131091.1 30S ribosomal protein S6 [Candidatus Neomarinimicrobiota bacterium]MBT4295397.1 30S ribosomal protein S6 [Candidatus Neomarinimicrobiota bacterium]MBT4418871.1 30S ribosomal protein S6 [Candidatus Neomarinimicrobiota bacterium]
MKKYECLYIVNINFDSEGISAVVARVEEVLKNVGGELANTQHWGKRKLAYAIDKERYGNYVLMHFKGENPDISELAREFEIESGVLHYMTIRLDEFPDFETLSVPQAFEADRGRRPGGRDSRDGSRPRRYEKEEAPAPAEKTSDEVVEDVAEVAAEAAEENAETAEVIEETPVEVAEETTEEVAEEAAKEEVAEEPAAPEAEVEESADETPEEEAEKPADAE